MSSKQERRARANRIVIPIKVKVRQKDGTTSTQRVDADVREDKRNRPRGDRDEVHAEIDRRSQVAPEIDTALCDLDPRVPAGGY